MALVAGLAGGLALFIILLIIIICCCCCKKKKLENKATSVSGKNGEGKDISAGSAQSIQDYPMLNANYHGVN